MRSGTHVIGRLLDHLTGSHYQFRALKIDPQKYLRFFYKFSNRMIVNSSPKKKTDDSVILFCRLTLFTFSSWESKHLSVVGPQIHNSIACKISSSNIADNIELSEISNIANWTSFLVSHQKFCLLCDIRSCQNKLFFPHWLAVSIYTMITGLLTLD